MALPVVVGGASKTTTTRPSSSSSSSSSRSRSSTSSTTSTRTMRIGLVVVFMVGSTLLKYPSILKSFLVVVGPSSSASSSTTTTTTTTSTTEISSTALSSSSSSSSSSSHRLSWRDLPDGCVTRPYKSGPMTTMSSSTSSEPSSSFSIPQVLEDAFRLLDAHLDEHAPLSGHDNTGSTTSSTTTTSRRRYWKDVRPMSVAATSLQGYKVNFLWNVIQRWKDGDGADDGDGGGDNKKKVECRTVCEVGLNAGHSSVLWLEACPEANAVLFDLPKNRYSQAAYDFLKLHYASRITAITLGNSLETIPQYIIQQQQQNQQQQQHSNGSSRPLRCDLIAIDGSKDPSIRYQDMEHFKTVAHADTLLLLDDASFDVMKAEYLVLSKNKNSLDKAMQQEDNKLDLNALYSALVVTDYLQLDGACASPGALNARQNASIAAHYIL